MRFRTLLKLAVVLAIIGGAIFWWLTTPSLIAASALAPRTANLENGKTLFDVGGCASCHATPKKEAKPEDRFQLGGGHAMHTPFGTFKAPNISPDSKAGIGGWSEIEFVNAMVRGVGRRGEHLYPSFPYTSYQRMRLDDVRDLFAFIKTLPAVAKPSEPHELGFPFNIRRGLGMWKLLYLDGKTHQDVPGRSAQLNRGAYLVEGPGHCAECHTPRNFMGGMDNSRRFAGGPDPEGKGWVPNITPHADGLAKWRERDIAYLLETGQTPEGDGVGGTMTEVSTNTSYIPAQDRAAMAAYLKALPPIAGARKK